MYGPVEVISAVNVVVPEETFTVKCFLTMMAPKSKKVDKHLVTKKIVYLTHSTCHVWSRTVNKNLHMQNNVIFKLLS